MVVSSDMDRRPNPHHSSVLRYKSQTNLKFRAKFFLTCECVPRKRECFTTRMTPRITRRCRQLEIFAFILYFVISFQEYRLGCLGLQGYHRSRSFSQQKWTHLSRLANMDKYDEFSDDDFPLTPTRKMIRFVLDLLRESEFILQKHKEHVESESVTHLFKGSPFPAAPAELKLQFVESWAGRALSNIIREEGIYLKTWKIDRIIEAAGNDFDEATVRAKWGPEVLWKSGNDVVVYSFEDCPWCIAAVTLLQSLRIVKEGNTKIKIVELETLGPVGKQLRAILAKETGRTSMPCIFIRGKCIGGFTDGEPCGLGLEILHKNGDLEKLLS